MPRTTETIQLIPISIKVLLKSYPDSKSFGRKTKPPAIPQKKGGKQLSKKIADGEFDPEKVQIILFEKYGVFDPRSDQGFCGKFFALMQVSKSCDTVDSEA